MKYDCKSSGKLLVATVLGIEMIETIKANNAENGFFSKRAGYHASVNTARQKLVDTGFIEGDISI